jgi:membrane fusion protein (multidrug efflux system)
MMAARVSKQETTPGSVERVTTVVPDDDGSAQRESSKKPPVRLIAGSVLAIGVVVIAGWYIAHAGLESTDDAQVEADVVAVPSRTAGAVIKVDFIENQPVKAGDLLVEIDPRIADAKLAQAEAELASARAAADAADAQVAIVNANARGQKSVAEASLAGATFGATATGDEIAQADAQLAAATAARQQAQLDIGRVTKLFDTGALPKGQLDLAQTALDTAEAALSQAKARQAGLQASRSQAFARIGEARARLGQSSAVEAEIAAANAQADQAKARMQTAQAMLNLAAIELSYTKIVAPLDGVASKKSATVGQMLSVGQPVVMIVPSTGMWVTANYKETQLDKMRAGQGATVRVDAYPGLELRGRVESVSGATGARFSLLPPDNATGNFTKVVQRVPIRIQLDGTAPEGRTLRAGMSADVTVDTRH